MKVNKKTKELEIRVTLHKIPPQFVEFHPTPTMLIVHTLQYSKKYYLEKPYPFGIHVSADDNSEAEFEYGILKASLPITKDPEGATVTLLGKRRLAAEAENAEANKSEEEEAEKDEVPKKKVKRDNKQEEELETSENGNNDQKPKQSPKSSPKASPKKKAQKKTEKKAENEINEQEEITIAPKFTSKKTAMDLIDMVNSKQEQIINSKLQKEKSKIEWQTERKEVKDKRKKNKQEKKQNEVKIALEIIQKEKEVKRKETLERKKQKKTVTETITTTTTTSSVATEIVTDNLNESSDSLLPIPNELKSIIKQGRNTEKKGVQFSPQLCQVKPIARVKNPSEPAPSLVRYMLRQQVASAKPARKKKNKWNARR